MTETEKCCVVYAYVYIKCEFLIYFIIHFKGPQNSQVSVFSYYFAF